MKFTVIATATLVAITLLIGALQDKSIHVQKKQLDVLRRQLSSQSSQISEYPYSRNKRENSKNHPRLSESSEPINVSQDEAKQWVIDYIDFYMQNRKGVRFNQLALLIANSDIGQKIKKLDSSSYPKILKALSSSPDLSIAHKRLVFAHLMRSLPKVNAEETLNFSLLALKELNYPKPAYSNIIGESFGSLLAKDPQRSYEWLNENKETLGNKVTKRFFKELGILSSMNSPELAFQMIDQLKKNNADDARLGKFVTSDDVSDYMRGYIRRGGAAGLVGMTHGLASPSEFIDFHQSLQQQDHLDSESRSTITTGFMIQLADGSPEEVAEVIENTKFTDQEIETLAKNIAVQSGYQKADQWVEWFHKQEDLSPRYLEKYMDRWAQADHQTFGRWLNEQEEGPLRQLGAYRYARTLAKFGQESAADWAESLNNPAERNEVLRTIAQPDSIEDAPEPRRTRRVRRFNLGPRSEQTETPESMNENTQSTPATTEE